MHVAGGGARGVGRGRVRSRLRRRRAHVPRRGLNKRSAGFEVEISDAQRDVYFYFETFEA